MKPATGVTVWRRVSAVLLCLGVATVAEANAGLPMLTVVWPVAWMLLLPVVAVEALAAIRSTGLGWKRCLAGSAIANAASTVLGIPLTWMLLVGVEMLLPRGGPASGLASVGAKVLAVTVQAPWLIPYPSGPLERAGISGDLVALLQQADELSTMAELSGRAVADARLEELIARAGQLAAQTSTEFWQAKVRETDFG